MNVIIQDVTVMPTKYLRKLPRNLCTSSSLKTRIEFTKQLTLSLGLCRCEVETPFIPKSFLHFPEQVNIQTV